jgi:putative sterol carrier protein
MKGPARTTFQEVAALVPKLNASPAARNLMGAFPRVIQFGVQGEGPPFCIRIENGTIELQDTIPNRPQLVVHVLHGKKFLDVLRGRLDISHTFASGDLTVEHGKASEMILLNRILAAAQKGAKS